MKSDLPTITCKCTFSLYYNTVTHKFYHLDRSCPYFTDIKRHERSDTDYNRSFRSVMFMDKSWIHKIKVNGEWVEHSHYIHKEYN
jgi:hypothetical protein